MTRLRPLLLLGLLVVALAALALLRPIDHDESQYVAAAALTAHGLLPYRDFAYLQTPLQPFLFAPLAWGAGDWAWPVLRIANALLGAVTVAATWRAMRVAGVGHGVATAVAALFATCDILLFSAGTARNDALPAALLALALVPIVRADRAGAGRAGAALAGVLLAAAAAAKLSYAVPAAAYGAYALLVPRHRPVWILLGAALPAAFVAALFAASAEGFAFGVLTFPTLAPAEYYAASRRLWKLTLWAKALDVTKFLALGPAVLALVIAAGAARREKPRALFWLSAAGLVAAIIPSPTWRQYLLPALPPLFVLLAAAWQASPPRRPTRILAVVLACAGLAPSVEALAKGPTLFEGMAATRALSALGLGGPVATLSPQVLPAVSPPDPRFAAGPFYFRSTGLLQRDAEARLHLISRARLDLLLDRPPRYILVGGEGAWTSGDDRLDQALERWAQANGWTFVRPIGTRFRLYARARSGASPSISAR